MSSYYERNKDTWKNIYYPKNKEQRKLNKKINTYQDGKIYKIVDNTNGDIYIGSTICSLQKRLWGHKTDSKKRRDITSCKIILNGDYKIELIENYPCNTHKELLQREQYYIDNTDCINKHNAKKDKKEYNKQYKIDNKDWFNFKRRQNRLWGDNLWRIECY